MNAFVSHIRFYLELDNLSYHVNIIIFDYILFARLCVHDYMNAFTHLRACLCLQSPHTYINIFFTVSSCLILVFHLNFFVKKKCINVGGGSMSRIGPWKKWSP